MRPKRANPIPGETVPTPLEDRDRLTGPTPGGLGGPVTGGGIGGGGLGGTEGSETGEGTRATTPGGWGGTDDDSGSSLSDEPEEPGPGS